MCESVNFAELFENWFELVELVIGKELVNFKRKNIIDTNYTQPVLKMRLKTKMHKKWLIQIITTDLCLMYTFQVYNRWLKHISHIWRLICPVESILAYDKNVSDIMLKV